MAGELAQAWSQADEVRRLVPISALAVAVVAVVVDPPSSLVDLVLAAVPVVALAVWAHRPGVPLAAVAVGVLAPVVAAQRSGALEPLTFEACQLALVVGRWAATLAVVASLGLLAVATPVLASLLQSPSEVSAGIWILGIAFSWAIARAVGRQAELAGRLDAARQELAQQALLAERRRIARDVHDLVGHGLAAVMLQVTSARHVLRRDPAAAEEALRSAEEVGRDSMHELRRTVALLRSDDEAAVPPPLPTAHEVPGLVDHARASGLAVELHLRGDLSGIAPSVGVAVYRIAQEALANAARHAPSARTTLRLERDDGGVSLVVETAGPAGAGARTAAEADRPTYGVIGMRERASALGGELTAGPTAEGWRVACRLPAEADDQGAVAP